MPVYIVSVRLTKRFSTDIRVEAANPDEAEGLACDQAQAQFDSSNRSAEIDDCSIQEEEAH